MRRPKQAKGFQCILVKLCKSQWLPAYKKPMTLHTYKLIDFLLSILTHQTLVTPGVLGLSRLLLSLPLFPMLHTYLWSSLRSFPIPWPCSLPFHCKSSFHILYHTAYYRCKGKCGPILDIISACRTGRFCSQLSTTSRDCDHNGHSQY
jgi:hypothetical protein